MNKKIKRKLAGIIFLIGGLYYLLAEYISANASPVPTLDVYLYHSISQLGVPIGALYYGAVSNFSPMFNLMNSAFIFIGIILLIGCFLEINKRINKFEIFYYPLLFICAIGVILVGIFHTGNPTTLEPHLLGAVMAIAGGNILLLVIGKSANFSKDYKNITILLSIIGLLCAVMTLISEIFPTIIIYQSIFERISVYTLIIWSIMTGISLTIQ